MPTFKLSNPIIFVNGTGLDIDRTGQELSVDTRTAVNFAIGQDVGSGSNVQFNQLIAPVIIDNGSLRIYNDTITGSFTQTGNLTVTENLTLPGTYKLTIGGILTAEKIESQLTQSLTLFESGSTRFGDTIDDKQEFTGSLLTSGSLNLNYYEINEISDDTTLADEGTTNVITENAVRTYLLGERKTFQNYQRKSFAHTGSFVSVSTSSFTATTASAPSGFTSTSKEDFLFFINGAMMETDALNIEQSGSVFLLKVDTDSIGYDLQGSDEIVAWGKFDNQYYLDFDGSNDEVETAFSSSETPVPVTYSWWMKSNQTSRNYSVFGFGGNKKAFTTNFSSGRPIMWYANNWYIYWDDTSAQDDGEWHHWMVYNQPQVLSDSKLYVDGVLIDINLVRETGTLGTGNQGLTIGAYKNNSTNAGHHFSGSFREFAVFGGDKTGNATAYYNNGIPFDLSDEPELQGYWKMNEGRGDTVVDSSGGGNDGTVDGATWTLYK